MFPTIGQWYLRWTHSKLRISPILLESSENGRQSKRKTPKPIVLDNVRRFEGLSPQYVLLVGIDELTAPELIYVATSRASVSLETAGKEIKHSGWSILWRLH